MKLTNRSKVVSNKEMTFMEKLYLPEIFKGMAITLRHAIAGSKGKVWSYPEQIKPRAKVWRGLHVLKRDEEGRERCTSCGLCAVACPAAPICPVSTLLREPPNSGAAAGECLPHASGLAHRMQSRGSVIIRCSVFSLYSDARRRCKPCFPCIQLLRSDRACW